MSETGPTQAGRPEPGDDPDARPTPEDVPLLDAAMLPEVVAELAATTEMHTGRLDELAGLASELGGLTTTHAEEISALHRTVEALTATLAEAVDMARPSRWAWEFLTRDEAAQLWRETRWFVDYLTRRYPLSSEVNIPRCWYRHTVAVDELSDLYAAWREAYCAGSRPSAAMTAWRDRWLWPTLHRLAGTADWRECKERRKHVEPTARQDCTDDEFRAFIDADLAARPEKRAKNLPWPTKKPNR